MATRLPFSLNYGISFFFLLVLFAPTFSAITGKGAFDEKEFTKTEKKDPTAFPNLAAINAEDIAGYIADLKPVLDERLGLRTALIELNAKILYHLFGMSINNDSVVVGKSGWLFRGDNSNRVFSQHAGAVPSKPSNVKRFFSRHSKESEWLADQGVASLMVIAPDKHSIYPEYLPTWVEKPNRQKPLEQLLQLNEKQDTLDIVNLIPPMIDSKREYGDLLYRKTGTHWTALGAYVGYVEIAKAVREIFPEVQPLVVDSFEVEETDHGYSLAAMMKMRHGFDDIKVKLKHEKPFSVVTAYDFSDAELWSDKDRKIPKQEEVLIVNESAKNNLTVLIVRDSFATKISSLLYQTFRKTIFVPHQKKSTKKKMPSLVEKYSPDIVILEYVERMIYSKKGPKKRK
jgi:hypothetical protein